MILAAGAFTPALMKASKVDLKHLTELFEAKQETGEIKGLPREAQKSLQEIYELLPLLGLSGEALKEIYAQGANQVVVGWLLIVKGEVSYLKSKFK